MEENDGIHYNQARRNHMIYRDFQDIKLSALGFGAMRLPVLASQDGAIDEEATYQMIDTAMKGGINYYDTAWGYHNGNSDEYGSSAGSSRKRQRTTRDASGEARKLQCECPTISIAHGSVGFSTRNFLTTTRYSRVTDMQARNCE